MSDTGSGRRMRWNEALIYESLLVASMMADYACRTIIGADWNEMKLNERDVCGETCARGKLEKSRGNTNPDSDLSIKKTTWNDLDTN